MNTTNTTPSVSFSKTLIPMKGNENLINTLAAKGHDIVGYWVEKFAILTSSDDELKGLRQEFTFKNCITSACIPQ